MTESLCGICLSDAVSTRGRSCGPNVPESMSARVSHFARKDQYVAHPH